MTRPAVTLMTQVFPPESQAGANRTGAMADALARVSDLSVVTILPSYPSPDFHRKSDTLTGHDGARAYRITRTGAFHPHRGSVVVRAVRELAMAGRLAWSAHRRSGDVLIATSPSVFVGLCGALVAWIHRIPFVMDLRDLTWEYVADDARRTGSGALLLLSRWLRGVARRALGRAAIVSVSNAGIGNTVAELGIRPDRILHTPNGVSSDILERLLTLESPQPAPEPFVVTYAGALGYYQGMAVVLDVAEALPDVEFRLIGDGPERAALEDAVAARSLRNVSLPGYVDREALFGHYAESDVLFAQLRDLPVLDRAAFPSKPFEYMATGRPIVYSGTGITADFLAGSGAALITEPENARSISDAIRRLIADPELRRSLGVAGRRAAPRYRREEVMTRFAAAVVGAAGQS